MAKQVIYIRTSTEEQNPQNQLRDCKTLVTGEFEIFEEQQSAYKEKERPKFEEIRRGIKQRKFDSFICWDLDRIYRNRKKLISFFKFCKLYKCKVHSFRQQFFETINQMPEPFDEAIYDFMLQIMGWLAEDESKKKSDRVKLAVRRTPGKPTRSYRGNKWGRKAINRDEKIITAHKEGKTYREITKEVYYWDRNNHKKFVSLGYVSKILKDVEK